MFVDLAEYHSPTSREASITGELLFFDLTQVCYSYEEVNSPNYRRSSLCSLTLQNTTVPEAQSGFPPPPSLLTQPKRRKRKNWVKRTRRKGIERGWGGGRTDTTKRKKSGCIPAQADIYSRHGSAYTFFITSHTGTCPVEGWTSTELPLLLKQKKMHE